MCLKLLLLEFLEKESIQVFFYAQRQNNLIIPYAHTQTPILTLIIILTLNLILILMGCAKLCPQRHTPRFHIEGALKCVWFAFYIFCCSLKHISSGPRIRNPFQVKKEQYSHKCYETLCNTVVYEAISNHCTYNVIVTCKWRNGIN